MKRWSEAERRLIELAQAGDVAAIEALLDVHEARPRALATALYYAAQNGHGAAIDALFSRGARPDELAGAGPKVSALEGAVRSGRREILEHLLAAGAPVDLQSWSKQTSPLVQAVADGKAEMVALLIAAHASPTRPHAGEVTARSVAVDMLAAARSVGGPTAERERIVELVQGQETPASARKGATKALSAHGRAAATLRFATKDDPSADPGCSHLHGAPRLAPDEPWPTCPRCHQPMIFRARLRLEDFPFLERTGVLQLFDCIHTQANLMAPAEAWVSFRPTDEGTAPRTQAGATVPRRPLARVGKANTEWPGPLLRGTAAPSLGGLKPAERSVALDLAADVDKVGGWPWAPEALEVPTCPECGEGMQLVLQLCSNGNLPYVAGSSSGRMYVSSCPRHPEKPVVQLVAADW